MQALHARPIIKFLPAMAASMLLSALPVARADVTSFFDTDAEGWTGYGDFAVNVNWHATGGNPGGTIELVDSVSGGVMYWVAPAKFLGNQSGSYGRTLSFDLRQVIGSPNQFSDSDVVLVGSGVTLVIDLSPNPATNGAWTSFSVPLSTGAWKVGSLGGTTATAAQLQSVLGNLSGLAIRAEYQTGADTDYLDNVVLSAVPEPSAWAAMALGLGVLGWQLRSTRRSD